MIKDLKHLMRCTELAFNSELMLSRKNCHAENISSIVLYNDSGKLIRVFLAWPGHKLNRNDYPVGIHNHRYAVQLKHIYGDIEHVIYKVSAELGDCSNLDLIFKEYVYLTDGIGHKPSFEYRGLVLASEYEASQLTSTFLTAHDMHNMYVNGPAAWMVQEGKNIKDTVRLLLRGDVPSFEGLYQKFESADEVRDHVRKFCTLCE